MNLPPAALPLIQLWTNWWKLSQINKTAWVLSRGKCSQPMDVFIRGPRFPHSWHPGPGAVVLFGQQTWVISRQDSLIRAGRQATSQGILVESSQSTRSHFLDCSDQGTVFPRMQWPWVCFLEWNDHGTMCFLKCSDHGSVFPWLQ